MPVDWSVLDAWVDDDGSNTVGNLQNKAGYQAAFRDPINAALGAQVQCQGRLTLTSAVPVTTADVTAAGTIYFTPYLGSLIALYTGSVWVVHTFTERSLALTLTSGLNYDNFIYDNAGTLTLETLAWTNDTTRATALALQDGVYVKSGATTRRYLGTIRASGTNTTEDSLTKRFVWNAHHRVARPMRRLDTTDSWTYTTATIRQANGSTANQLDLVVGLSEDAIAVIAHGSSVHSVGAIFRNVGIGEDSTTAYHAGETHDWFPAQYQIGHTAHLVTIPAIGRHFYAWLEFSEATGTTTWYGDFGGAAGSQKVQTGIHAVWRA